MSLISKFFSVGAATMASRVLGFVREALIAGFLGAGPVADAFYAAFRFPNLFRRIFAEGAFNAAFIPLFSKELETGGTPAARKFAEQILGVLLATLILLSGLAMIFMPFLVGTIIAPAFAEDPAKFDLTVLLTRIMFPFLATMSLVAMLSGILNTFRRYFFAALAPVVMNIVFIVVLLGAWQMGANDRMIGVSMAWGVLVSGVLQVAMLLYGVRKQGFEFSLRWPQISPPVKRLVLLAIPTAIAAGITQVNLLVGQIIASGEEGAISIMNYADRLMQLPIGLIAVSIGVVLLPELSRALAANDLEESSHLQNRSIEFGLALMVPAAVGLAVIPMPIVALLYERGAFDRELTEITSAVLAVFALSLPAVVLTKIFQPSFFARQDTKTPMIFSGVNAAVNIALALLLFDQYGVVGLAWAFTIASWVNTILLAANLYISNLFRPGITVLRNTIFILIASAAMGAMLYFASLQFDGLLMEGSVWIRLAMLIALMAASAVIYFGIVIGTGAIPRAQVKRLLRRR